MGFLIKLLLALLATVLALVLLLLAWGLLFGLPGSAPDGLGVQPDGRLAACPETPNCVVSTATGAPAAIAPLPLPGPADQAMERLRTALESLPRTRVLSAQGGYLHATQSSRMLGFVDDIELLVDPQAGVVHVRSASRLGRRDFGVNRQRIETLRAALAENR